MGIKEMFQNAEQGFIKWAAIALAAFLLVFLLGYGVGHCQVGAPPPKIEATGQLYKAELDEKAKVVFEQEIQQKGFALKIVEGCAFCKAEGLKTKTYNVITKCLDDKGNVYIVLIAVVHDQVVRVEGKATGERMLDT